MCGTCGCGEDEVRVIAVPVPEHAHDHGHHHEPDQERTVVLEQRVLGRNDELAAATGGDFAERGIVAVNLMSSPGSGKTPRLERTVRELGGTRPVAVIEGDQETTLHPYPIRATVAP